MTKIKEVSSFKPFETMQEVNPDLNFFTVFDGSEIDLVYNNMFSERVLIYPEKDNHEMSAYLLACFKRKWENAFDLMKAADLTLANLGNDSIESRITSEAINDNQTDNNSISAYNETGFSDNTQDTKGYDRDRNVTETINKSDKDLSKIQYSFEYLRKTFVIDILLKDANSILCYAVM